MARVAIRILLVSVVVLVTGCPIGPPVTIGVRVSPRSQQVDVGKTIQFAVSSLDPADTSFAWSSSNDTIATVDPAGSVVTVTGVRGGQVTLSVTGSHSATMDTAEVTVVPVVVDEQLIAANETSALNDICRIFSAQLAYLGDHQTYAPDFASLLNAIPPYLTGDWTVIRSGYNFAMSVVTDIPGSFTVNAEPAEPGVTGRRYFFMDESGFVRYNSAAPATVSDPTVDPAPCP